MSFRIKPLALRAALVGGNMFAITACQNANAPVTPAKLAVSASSSSLVATVGTFVPGGVTVQVQDAAGAAIPGAIVSFIAMNGSASSAASIVSDADVAGRHVRQIFQHPQRKQILEGKLAP